MPELPEVELARENLADWLAGQRIRDLRAPDPRIRRGQPEAVLRAAAAGRVVTEVRRRAKFLLFGLRESDGGNSDGGESDGRDAGAVFLSHLGMTGRWTRCLADAPDPPAARATLFLRGGVRLVFSDRRRFGSFSLLGPADEARLARLGPEPLSAGFTARRFGELLGASARPVKVLLMDQDRIAGIGNIQATESLWRAGVHPARAAKSLEPEEVRRLHRALRGMLRRTLAEARGVEIRYVSDGDGGRESARARFSVYLHQGETCPGCRAGRIRRVRLGGRSSFYCPRCQPAKP